MNDQATPIIDGSIKLVMIHLHDPLMARVGNGPHRDERIRNRRLYNTIAALIFMYKKNRKVAVFRLITATRRSVCLFMFLHDLISAPRHPVRTLRGVTLYPAFRFCKYKGHSLCSLLSRMTRVRLVMRVSHENENTKNEATHQGDSRPFVLCFCYFRYCF